MSMGSKIKRVGTCLVLFIIICFAMASRRPVLAEEAPVAKIHTCEGEVNILRSGGTKTPGEAGLPLFAGDCITTGKGGTAWFAFSDNKSRFKLAEHSVISIDELSGTRGSQDQPTLRLVLGYLKTICAKLGKRTSGLTLHTPTAVIGVRGTEFDTVASVDGTCVILVDEGAVELEVEERRVIIHEGNMADVNIEGKASLPVPAIPKQERDWSAWREKRIENLLANLPDMIPGFRNRFKRAVFRSKRFTTTVKQAAEDVRASILEVRLALSEGSSEKIGQARMRLRQQMPGFKKLVGKFRRAANRVRAMGSLSLRVQHHFAENKARFTVDEVAIIESNLSAILLKRRQLQNLYRSTIFNIKGTFRELRELKEASR